MAEDEGVPVKMFCGVCPDSHCGKLLYFMSHVNIEVECSSCGQKHSPRSLLNIQESSDSNIAVGNLLKSILLSNTATKKGVELVKVRGLSNFHCKLISPLLTKYGMDKKTGKAKLLSELGQSDVFNCSVFGNRAFLIEKEHLDIPGYGRDNTGSLGYLKDTLELIESANSDSCLVPLHSDGDGHCLVHAISRGVVGRELFWHSLRQNLKDHLVLENIKYQGLFQDFIDTNEWDEIIAEADPDYRPETSEPFGLRNIHVFGLANVLHRPIILLDSLEGMQSCGDYSGLFLPVLAPLEQCKPQGILNKPLAIAWSSLARNHYVPLVGIKDSPLPKIPRSLLPKAWGIPNELVSTYIEFDESGCCAIGGSRSLLDSYVQRLVSAMDDMFFEKHEVCPELVADVNQFVFKPSNAVGISIPEIIEFTHKAVASETLFRCLSCNAMKEVKDVFPRSWREPGGKWYTRVQEKGPLADALFQFEEAKGVVFRYDVTHNMLMPFPMEDMKCDFCKGEIREVTANGSVRYMNGDRTTTKSTNNLTCKCGFKHFWNGNEYDNSPTFIDVSLEWNGIKIEDKVFWFDQESDPSLNSNVYELATSLVQKHFPGEFGSETLVRKVVDKILRETELKKTEDEGPALLRDTDSQHMDTEESEQTPTTPSKIILIGSKKKTLHREELTMSEEEKLTKARITHRAAYSQKRKSSKGSPEKPSGSTKHGKQELQKANKENTKPKVESIASVTKPLTSASATSGPAKPRDLKIRLTSSDGRTSTVTLKPSSTYANLQDVIQTELGIPKDRQKIRYGFPPRELKPPEEENTVLPLTHGDRVSVEELPELKAAEEERLTETGTESMDIEGQEGTSTAEENSASVSEELEDSDREKLASNLLSLLQGALNVDKWETVQHKPELFARGGMIYDQVVAKFGQLKDDMHCAIAGLPGKTFAYNEKEDRFEVCLGQKHIPVQPLDSDTLSRAHDRNGDMAQMRRPASRDDGEGLGAFSGVVRHRNASEGRAAFSGTGRTLGGSVKTINEEKKEVLAPMNVDVTNDGTTHVQVTTQDASSSGTPADKLGNNDTEGATMDTQSGVEVTNQSVPSDIEMSELKNDQNIAHDLSKNTHETSANAHEATTNAHETSTHAHETGTKAHETSTNAHEASTNAHETATNAHETSSTEDGASSFEHEVSKTEPVLSNEQNEIDDGDHKLINVEHSASLAEHEVEQTKHETLNDA